MPYLNWVSGTSCAISPRPCVVLGGSPDLCWSRESSFSILQSIGSSLMSKNNSDSQPEIYCPSSLEVLTIIVDPPFANFATPDGTAGPFIPEMLASVQRTLLQRPPRAVLVRGFFSMEDVLARKMQEQESFVVAPKRANAKARRLSPVMHHAGRKEPYAPAPVARVVGRSFGAITRQLTIRQPVTKSVCDTNMSGPEPRQRPQSSRS